MYIKDTLIQVMSSKIEQYNLEKIFSAEDIRKLIEETPESILS